MAEIDIRYTTLDDEPYLRDWLDDEDTLSWFPLSEEKEVEIARKVWIGFSRFSASITAMLDGEPCGIGTLFLMPYRKVAHQCIIKLIVDPKKRRQGIGNDLLRNLVHLAKNYFRLELVVIDIKEGNPIVHLLEKQAFKKVMAHPKYFKEGEVYFDRLVYERAL